MVDNPRALSTGIIPSSHVFLFLSILSSRRTNEESRFPQEQEEPSLHSEEDSQKQEERAAEKWPCSWGGFSQKYMKRDVLCE
ncbi:hypothetical protein AOLI_G00266260 [Acnodon oligacanthus]